MENLSNTAKDEVKALLMKLPDDCSIEDIQYHLYVLEKIRERFVYSYRIIYRI
ncbi:MAG: hypothetical protein ACREOO_20215 [bacterium]